MENKINKRQFYRIHFENPLCSQMTIVKFKGNSLKMGYANVCVKDIGPGGLSFLSVLDLPIGSDSVYRFRIKLFGESKSMSGEIVRIRPLKDNVKEYGVKFTFTDTDEPSYIADFHKLQISLARDIKSNCCEFCRKESIPCTQDKS